MESLSKEIKCPLCNRPVTLKVDSEIINCSNCKGRYIYKYCLECSSIIYFPMPLCLLWCDRLHSKM